MPVTPTCRAPIACGNGARVGVAVERHGTKDAHRAVARPTSATATETVKTVRAWVVAPNLREQVDGGVDDTTDAGEGPLPQAPRHHTPLEGAHSSNHQESASVPTFEEVEQLPTHP